MNGNLFLTFSSNVHKTQRYIGKLNENLKLHDEEKNKTTNQKVKMCVSFFFGFYFVLHCFLRNGEIMQSKMTSKRESNEEKVFIFF